MAQNNKPIRRRKSIRLKNWDYAAPATYFVTICTWHRTHLFNDPRFREIAEYAWLYIPNHPHARHVILDEWIVMPNHLHGIITLTDCSGQQVINRPKQSTRARSLPSILGNYKSLVTRRINNLRHTRGGKVWQRGYYESIVRNNQSLRNIRRYIQANPARWAEDRDNLEALFSRMQHIAK